jgi:hypothetical protein
MKSVLELAGRAAAADSAAAAEEIAVELRQARTFSLDPAPRVVVLTVDPRPESLSQARGVEQTLQHMGWPAASCLPDSPARCHTLARLTAVRDHAPDFVLFMNCFPGKLESFVHSDQPSASWFLLGESLRAGLTEGVPARGVSLAATSAMEKQLLDAGLASERVGLLETGADTLVFRPLDGDARRLSPYSCDVAVLGDLADLRPEAGHVSTDSHARLFETLVKSAPAWAGPYSAQRANDVLVQAERECERPLKEEGIRNSFVSLIRQVIAPTVVSRLVVERLAKAGLRVRVWGRNWSLPVTMGAMWQGVVPLPEKRNVVYNAARVVVCPFFTSGTAQTVLDVLAAGGRPVYRRADIAVKELHPQLGELLGRVPGFHRVAEIEHIVQAAGRDAPAGTTPCDEARRIVYAEHTLTHRLESIRQRARALFG